MIMDKKVGNKEMPPIVGRTVRSHQTVFGLGLVFINIESKINPISLYVI